MKLSTVEIQYSPTEWFGEVGVRLCSDDRKYSRKRGTNQGRLLLEN